VLPCVVLVILSLRIIDQERELAEKRALDERGRITSEISEYLFNRLETIKNQELNAESLLEGYINPEVVLLGQVEDNQLKLPWEIRPEDDSERQSLYQRGFTQKIRLAEEEELVNKNFSRASQLYQQILKTSETRTQRGYAQLLLARVQMKSGQIEEATSLYNNILALPSNITDEFNIPIFLYAAGRLSDNDMLLKEVTKRIQKRLDEIYPMSPSESYMTRDICEKLIETVPDTNTKDTAKQNLLLLQKNIDIIEQALTLQREFPGLLRNLQSEQQETVWTAYGDRLWLLSLTSSMFDSKSVLIVVSVPDVLGALQFDKNLASFIPRDVHFVSEGTGLGEYMGSNFRGIRIAFSESQENALIKQQSLQRSFYLLALFLVIGVTLFGAYLLWRDVRRDLRLAEMRSQFVSSVSHELKTPLTSIRMFAETLRLRRSKDQKMQDEYLDTIVNESQRLTRLLNNVLDFSKIEKGKRIYKMEPSSLSEIFRTVVRTMEYPLSQQDFKLHVQIEEEIPDIRVDGDAIEQAILNLLSNAMKYSGDSRDIDLKLEKTEDQAVIRVIDRGIGIDSHEQKKIFDKFYRVPSPENERTAGTGLGLSLVTHIVEAHGGRLGVESKKEHGSAFSIFLPLKREF
jgi:signal transduction histidine kinase